MSGRRLAWCGWALLFLTGCSSDPGPGLSSAPPSALPQATALELAGPPKGGAVALFRDHSEIRVGDLWESAREVFPQPPRGAYDLRDLPANFPKDYEAKGWETAAGEGFGVIMKDSRVEAAMYQLERTKEDVVQDFLKLATLGMGALKPKAFTGNNLRYWFWADPTEPQSLMVLAESDKTGLHLTLAMGDNNVLAALGVSEGVARSQVAAHVGPAAGG